MLADACLMLLALQIWHEKFNIESMRKICLKASHIWITT